VLGQKKERALRNQIKVELDGPERGGGLLVLEGYSIDCGQK
jgi:hypothetical protein